LQLASLTLGAPFEGTRIGYVEWGPGDAAHSVICVHGLTRNGRDFDALGEALASRGFRVIAVDVVGRGRSSWLADPRQYLVPVYAAQLKLVVEVLGLGAVDWVGTSMGGLIGMVLAAGQPQLIRRLVLNDIGPFVPMAALQQLRTYVGVNPQFANLDEAETYLRSIHAGFGPLSDSQWRQLTRDSVVAEEGGGVRLHYDPAIGEAYADLAEADIDLWELWDQIRCPVLLLRGGDSPLLTAAVAERMGGSGPHARLVTFEGIGHAPALVTADQISVVTSWLSGSERRVREGTGVTEG
jgi:pimeloyl-ACP methyl ester carboxylesterase